MRLLIVVATLVAFLAPHGLRADKGELAIGPQVTSIYPVAGRLGAAARLGLTDWISVEARLGIGYDRQRLSSNAVVGLVLAWDVLTWVPEFSIAAGVSLPDGELDPRFGADVGFRHHFGLSTSFGLAAGAEWGPLLGWTATARMTLWLAFL